MTHITKRTRDKHVDGYSAYGRVEVCRHAAVGCVWVGQSVPATLKEGGGVIECMAPMVDELFNIEGEQLREAVRDPVANFFFSSRRRHTRFKCDWSSDVCSSD